MRPFILSASVLCVLSAPAFAVGSDDETPPTPTETTTVCEDGQIYDDNSKECVSAETQSLNDDQRYRAVRELAYAGDYPAARRVIETAASDDPRFLNYRGFLARKEGRWSEALGYYEAALAIDPDYLLARSYMGMGFVAEGDQARAKHQLAEIRQRGGKNTWAYVALKQAIMDGPQGY